MNQTFTQPLALFQKSLKSESRQTTLWLGGFYSYLDVYFKKRVTFIDLREGLVLNLKVSNATIDIFKVSR